MRHPLISVVDIKTSTLASAALQNEGLVQRGKNGGNGYTQTPCDLHKSETFSTGVYSRSFFALARISRMGSAGLRICPIFKPQPFLRPLGQGGVRLERNKMFGPSFEPCWCQVYTHHVSDDLHSPEYNLLGQNIMLLRCWIRYYLL